jgi:hypothetical protein
MHGVSTQGAVQIFGTTSLEQFCGVEHSGCPMKEFFNWWGGAKYAGYVGATAADERKVCWYDAALGDPLPQLGKWKAPLLSQYLGDGPLQRKPRKIGDAPSSGVAII